MQSNIPLEIPTTGIENPVYRNDRRDIFRFAQRKRCHVPLIFAGMTILLLTLSILSGCAGNVILSDDAIRIRKTIDMINELKGLYEQRDDRILTEFSPEYLSKTGVKDAISQDMGRFSSISLNIFIDRIEIYNDVVNASVHWNGSWVNGEKTLREGGSAVVIIQYGDSLKILDIKGDSPFGMSNR